MVTAGPYRSRAGGARGDALYAAWCKHREAPGGRYATPFVDPKMEVEREGLVVVLSPVPPTRPLVLRPHVDLAGPSLPCA